jgi:hypothetical protein
VELLLVTEEYAERQSGLDDEGHDGGWMRGNLIFDIVLGAFALRRAGRTAFTSTVLGVGY